MFNITNNQGNANQNHNKKSPHTHQDDYYLKEKKKKKDRENNRCCPGCGEIENLWTIGGNVKWNSPCGKECGCSSKN